MKCGLGDEPDAQPDLDEARKLIDALAGLVTASAPHIGDHHARALRDGLRSRAARLPRGVAVPRLRSARAPARSGPARSTDRGRGPAQPGVQRDGRARDGHAVDPRPRCTSLAAPAPPQPREQLAERRAGRGRRARPELDHELRARQSRVGVAGREQPAPDRGVARPRRSPAGTPRATSGSSRRGHPRRAAGRAPRARGGAARTRCRTPGSSTRARSPRPLRPARRAAPATGIGRAAGFHAVIAAIEVNAGQHGAAVGPSHGDDGSSCDLSTRWPCAPSPLLAERGDERDEQARAAERVDDRVRRRPRPPGSAASASTSAAGASRRRPS